MSAPDDNAFAKRLRVALALRKVTQRDLAKRVDCNPATVTAWMQGKHEPGLTTLQTIARTLNVPVGWLIEGEGVVVGWDV